jgi:Predicted symporter
LFLIQRGIAAGITIYAPAIILSALLGWRLNLTIWLAGGLVIVYTVIGGTKIVSITQRYQMIVILVGMAIAFAVAVYRLSPDLSFENTLSIAGKMGNWKPSISRSTRTSDIHSGRALLAGFSSRCRISERTNRRCNDISREARSKRVASGYSSTPREGADAVFHSAARRDCFHVLPIRKSRRLISINLRTSERWKWLCATVNAVANAIR